ncbi:MAG: type 1 glutamine amidotransferase [Sulfurimonas sp.]
MSAKPLIGVCLPDHGNFFAYMFIKLHLKLQGASSVSLRPSKDNIAFEKLDGLILSGGDDIDPTLYGEDKDAHNTPLDKKRDSFELEMIDKAYKKKIPILGICRGAQIINIYFDGTLYPSILDLDKYIDHKNSIFVIKDAIIKKVSKLFSITKRKKLPINSIHNQAIDEVGDALKVTACHDKIVEAIEKEDYPFLLGVQWHPEYLIYLKDHRLIFKEFVSFCMKVENFKF